MSLQALQLFLKQTLCSDPYRYFHSLLVLDIALDLSTYTTLETESLSHLEIAALMHDLCKYASLEEAKEFAENHGESVPSDLLDFPVCIHGFLASLKLKHLFQIQNTDILDAIQYHTTGKHGLSLIGVMLYISDFLASVYQTDMPIFLSIYKIAQNNLYEAAHQVCINKIQYLVEQKRSIHPFSLEFQDWLVLQIRA